MRQSRCGIFARCAVATDVFYDFDFYAGTARLQRQREEEARQKAARERREAERRAGIDAQLGPALRSAERGRVDAMREAIRLLAERDGITVEVRTEMPSGAAAYASWRGRSITIPPIENATTFAIALHELGHLRAGECTGREPHRPDPSVTRWHHCIKCELDAWAEALKLVQFSREMFTELQRGLRSYRRMTPAAHAEVDKLDRMTGTVTYAEARQKRLLAQIDAEKRERFARLEARLERARKGL
jgi:hypothetical protein